MARSEPVPSRNGVMSAITSSPSRRACSTVSAARCQAPGAAPVLWRTFRWETCTGVPARRPTSRHSSTAPCRAASRLRMWLA